MYLRCLCSEEGAVIGWSPRIGLSLGMPVITTVSANIDGKYIISMT